MLVEHEFEAPEEHRARMSQYLGQILRFAARHVPHYGNLFHTVGVRLDGDDPFETLGALPVMTKLDALDAGKALLAKALPPGDRLGSWWASSGTT
jgi:phenylacetate-coenzyme A ligase PaaK-like adenylate-forming protein